MHRLCIDNSLEPQKSTLNGYLKASNNVYQDLTENFVKNNEADNQIKKLARLGSNEENQIFHHNILLKENLFKTVLEKQEHQEKLINKYEERFLNMEAVQDNLKMKVEYATEGPKQAISSNIDKEHITNLEKQYKTLEVKLKKFSSNDDINEELERLERYLNEKIQRIDKKTNELADSFNDFSKNKSFDEEKLNMTKVKEDLEQLEKQITDLKTKNDADYIKFKNDTVEYNDRLNKKIQGLLQDLSNRPVSEGNITKESKPFNTMEFMLNELTDRVNDIESDFSKRLIAIDNQLKEFDDISKINKMISKINAELNNKLNKDIFENGMNLVLHKNDFYDFVNKNLIKKDKLSSFKFELNEFKEYVNNNLKEQDNYTKKLKNTFDSGVEDLEIKIKTFMNDIHKNDGLLSTLNKKMKSIETDQESLAKKHNDLKQWIVDQLQHRLNSLATSTGIRCLSCGEKDVNYPPLQKFSMGENGQLYNYQDDKYIYMNGVREELRQKNENVQVNKGLNRPQSSNKSNGFRLLSATTNVTNGNRLHSGKSTFKEPNNKKSYTLGQKVFSKQQIIHEHNINQHLPVEQTISMQPKFRNRPFSSIAVKNTLRNQ